MDAEVLAVSYPGCAGPVIQADSVEGSLNQRKGLTVSLEFPMSRATGVSEIGVTRFKGQLRGC
jgi:hypothetical protein